MRPLRRRASRLRDRPLIAYDLETTAIAAGTPEPRYLSLYDGKTVTGIALQSFADLHDAVVATMLTAERIGCRYVGYNANRFDATLIALALMHDAEYRIEPWLTRSKAFRGMLISRIDDPRAKWLFSDAMAMYGFLGTLDDFLRQYAPNEHKLHIDVIHFDNTNQEHIAYAHNDARALWVAATNAGAYLREVTGLPPQNTIGKTAIKYLESRLPHNVLIWRCPSWAESLLRDAVRGGYVYQRESYIGPTYKYDVNQAYCAAMRNPLPCGRAVYTEREQSDKLGVYEVLISRDDVAAIPFYCRDIDSCRLVHVASGTTRTALCSPEITHLREHGWTVTIQHGLYWSDVFDLSAMVDELEAKRMNCAGGPKGPLGTMYKMVGNNAYGKTLETHDGLRLVIAGECPDGYHHYQAEDEAYGNVFFTVERPHIETYHRPQLGAFITAYVRLQIMDAAWRDAANFVYADTDCVVFKRAVEVPCHPSKYGMFKIENNGEAYVHINKKVYCSLATQPEHPDYPLVAHAKGLHVADLTLRDFIAWYNGRPPEQTQTQRQNFLATLIDNTMFATLTRRGSFVLPRKE